MKIDLKKTASFGKQRHQNNQRAPKPVKAKRIEPTPEQQAASDFKSAGMAYRRTPVIDTLLAKDKITALQYTALSYYRDQASAADRSPIKSNIDFKARSGNQRSIGYQTPQEIETARIERDLGKLAPIVRAIAVDDLSLSQWCVSQYGGKEVLRGRRVSIEPSAKKLEIALLELKYGAGMIVI